MALSIDNLKSRASKCLLLSLASSFLVSLCLPLFVLSLDRQQNPETERSVYDLALKADGFYTLNQFGPALEMYKKAAALDPSSNSAYLHTQIASCYLQLKQYAQVRADASKAIQFEPGRCSPYYQMAVADYQIGNYDSATQTLKRLLTITTDRQWINSANDLLKQIDTYGSAKRAIDEIHSGHYEQAKKLLEQATRYDPCDVSFAAHSNLAYVYREIGQTEKAIDESKKALQFSPNEKTALYSLGIAYQDIGKFDEAISWLRRYVQAETDSVKRKSAEDLIKDLNDDKDKLDSSVDKLPDYLDHMVGGSGIRRWPEKHIPIKVHIEDGAGVKGFHSQYPSYVLRALDTWCVASKGRLSYVKVDDDKNADINVEWISHPISMKEGGRTRVKQGLATVSYSDEGIISDVKVQVDCMHSFEPSQPLPESQCASVCMHEIGHSLGLNHSPCLSDVMYFSASSKQTGKPTTRDNATMARLYESYPQSKIQIKVPKADSIKYMPPPAFMPPAIPTEDDLTPPLFSPPPLPSKEEQLMPPLFMPPPVESAEPKSGQKGAAKSSSKSGPNSAGMGSSKSAPKNSASDSSNSTGAPIFMPPALDSGKSDRAKNASGSKPKGVPNPNSKSKSKPDPHSSPKSTAKPAKNSEPEMPFFVPPEK